MRRAIRTVLLAALAAGGNMSCAAAVTQEPVVTADGVRFTLEYAGARSVAVAGDFNDWSVSSHPMVRSGSTTWRVVVALARGDHKFMFVVDGTQWVVPPVAEEYVDDGFGSRNGVVIVR
jgi:1,4-alpha-glucan branching enzyme